eukprot:g4576.t1
MQESLSTRCYSNVHIMHIIGVTAPAIVLYMLMIPGYFIYTIRRLRTLKVLYSQDENYQPRWTYRYGFLFAGYEPDVAYWEVVVLIRKAAFVLVTIFTRPAGMAAQIMAAVLVLLLSLSAHIHVSPYDHDTHDLLESASLHANLITLPVAMLANQFSIAYRTGSVGEGGKRILGPVESVVFSLTAILSFFMFVYYFIHGLLVEKIDDPGFVGKATRKRIIIKSAKSPEDLIMLGYDADEINSIIEHQPQPPLSQQILAEQKSRGSRSARRPKRTNTAHFVKQAVTHSNATKTAADAEAARNVAIAKIKEQERLADARVRQRLMLRRKKKIKGIKDWQVAPVSDKIRVTGDKRSMNKDMGTKKKKNINSTERKVQSDQELIESLRQTLAAQIKTPRRLEKAFKKLDKDHNTCNLEEMIRISHDFARSYKSPEGKSLADVVAPILDHIRKVIAQGDKRSYVYFLDWFAMKYQKVWCRMQTVIAVTGKEGSGKGTVFEFLAALFRVFDKDDPQQDDLSQAERPYKHVTNKLFHPT